MAEMKIYTIEELEDKHFGKIGTPRRDAFETAVNDEIRAYHIGEAIKAARKEKNMTQEELSARMGVQRAQISKIESGRNVTITTIARAFKALGVHAELTAGDVKLALW